MTETSFQARFLIPMAVSISFGLAAATLLTLVFVPALYVVVRDITMLGTGRVIPHDTPVSRRE
jgi:Cu/Ag efflux pump CusA